MSQETKIAGICGPSCSGKTRLAAAVAERLNPHPMTWSFDEYDLYPEGSPVMIEELAHPTITNWEDPALFEEESFVRSLLRVHEGRQTTIETRSRESIGWRKVRTLRPTDINIVEGIFIYRDERAIGAMGLRFFVDVPMDVLVQRRLERSRFGKMPWDDPAYIKGEMVRATEELVLPQMARAHFRLDGEKPTTVLAGEVINVMGEAGWFRR